MNRFVLVKEKKKQIRTPSVSSASTTISTNEIEAIVDNLTGQCHRNSTQKMYYTVWKLFNSFFIRLDRKPPTWGERLTLFVGFLVDQQKQSSTVKSYIFAIKAVLKTNGYNINENEFLLSSLMKACKLKNDKVTTRLPIHKGMLAIIIKRVQRTYNAINQPLL